MQGGSTSADSEDGSLSSGCKLEVDALIQSQKKNSRLCRNLTIAAIPVAAVLIFMSRPLVGYLSRELCYYTQGEPPTPGYNPVNWAKWAWHGTSSLYKCEWMGHWGFNWLSVMQWLSDKGTSVFTSLGILGGSYATWKSITTWLKKKTMTDDDKDKLRELAQHIHVKETEGGAPNTISFANTLRFSPPASRDNAASASVHDPMRRIPSALKSHRNAI